MGTQRDEVTQLLHAWSHGDRGAGARVLTAVYAELRRIAHRYMHREPIGHTLQSAALVNEAYLRLDGQHTAWRDRAHFFAIAAQLMRRILVDHARARSAAKRGARPGRDQHRVTIDDLADTGAHGIDLLDLERCLNALAAIDPRQARIVELRFFGGLTIDETAAVIGVSHTIIEREWSLARAWLRRELERT